MRIRSLDVSVLLGLYGTDSTVPAEEKDIMTDQKAKTPGKSKPEVEHPDACIKVTKKGAVPLRDAVGILRSWRRKHPNALQLDGNPTGRNNLKPWLHVRLEGFSTPRHDFLTKHSRELIEGTYYNGVWNFHGDAKVEAIDALLALFAAGGDPLDFLVPSATYEAKAEHVGDQNPKFTLHEITGGKGFYLYKE